MTYRELSREQLEKMLDEMREEKAKATERVLELEHELKNGKKKPETKIEVEKASLKIVANNSVVSNVHVGTGIHFEPKPWLKFASAAMLALIFVPTAILTVIGIWQANGLLGFFVAALLGLWWILTLLFLFRK